MWPAVKEINANTLSIPIAWEQIEPKEGEYNFDFLDVLLKEARENDVRLTCFGLQHGKTTRHIMHLVGLS